MKNTGQGSDDKTLLYMQSQLTEDELAELKKKRELIDRNLHRFNILFPALKKE